MGESQRVLPVVAELKSVSQTGRRSRKSVPARNRSVVGSARVIRRTCANHGYNTEQTMICAARVHWLLAKDGAKQYSDGGEAFDHEICLRRKRY